jgi:hypothetical protein
VGRDVRVRLCDVTASLAARVADAAGLVRTPSVLSRYTPNGTASSECYSVRGALALVAPTANPSPPRVATTALYALAAFAAR